ncbi:hypothetical protein JVU11DRAFT_48 [Chiua virens]|nr:hypothetical protein JVU11DRAFT_48 [Chiua virens]
MVPVDMLKKGLEKLWGLVQSWKALLEATLRAREPIPESDQEWLDNEANLIDEEWVIEAFECASDLNHETFLSGLDFHQKMIVEKLMRLGGPGGAMVLPSKKCKHRHFLHAKCQCVEASLMYDRSSS